MKEYLFEVKTENDSVIKLKTIEINSKIRRESDKQAALAFENAAKNGFMIQLQIERMIRDSGFDLNAHIQEIENLRSNIKQKEVKLLSGRDGQTKLTKLEGRSLAIEIKKNRSDLNDLVSALDGMYNRSAEKQSENERILYFVFATTIDVNTGRTYFRSFEDFKENSDSLVALEATRNFTKMLGASDESAPILVEDKWLKKFGFVNDKYQFIDHLGRLCDENFRLINSEGRYIDESGNFVDKFGNKINEDGDLIIDIQDAYVN